MQCLYSITQNSTERKFQANITNEHQCKNPQQYTNKQSKNTLKLYTITKWGLSQRCKDSSIYTSQSMWYTILINWKIKSIWLPQ